jgi:hypothetical protein
MSTTTGTHHESGGGSGRPQTVGGVLALLAALFALFPGSAALGVTLAEWLAPGSWIAQIAGFFALPLAFITGLQMWVGVAIVGAIVRLLVSRRFPPRAAADDGRAGLPGSFIFFPISSAAGLLAGVIVALVPAAPSAVWAIVVFWLTGTLHGLVAWRLADRGVLVPPDSV